MRLTHYYYLALLFRSTVEMLLFHLHFISRHLKLRAGFFSVFFWLSLYYNYVKYCNFTVTWLLGEDLSVKGVEFHIET